MNNKNYNSDNSVWDFVPTPAFTRAGTYLASFLGVEDFTLNSGETRWRWRWKIVSPEAYKDGIATALTERKLGGANKQTRLLTGMLGRSLKKGDKPKELVEGCEGQTFQIEIATGPLGGRLAVQSALKQE